MKKYNIEMTKDELIKYYANKIIEEGINTCLEFNNTIEVTKYKYASEYKEEIVKEIAKDYRVADVELDEEGNFDMVFYTDFCPNYSEEEDI